MKRFREHVRHNTPVRRYVSLVNDYNTATDLGSSELSDVHLRNILSACAMRPLFLTFLTAQIFSSLIIKNP